MLLVWTPKTVCLRRLHVPPTEGVTGPAVVPGASASETAPVPLRGGRSARLGRLLACATAAVGAYKRTNGGVIGPLTIPTIVVGVAVLVRREPAALSLAPVRPMWGLNFSKLGFFEENFKNLYPGGS